MEQPLILDRYRPLAELGGGGHGSVVLAYDTRMARRVAIKRLPLPTDQSGRPLQSAGLVEARTAAMLNHPNIVTVHEWDTDADEAFIIMEDVDGASVARILDDRGGPLDLDETAAVVVAVEDALAYAHANGVLHLDIKPENVLVTRDGRVKVADFGVSTLTDMHGHARGWAGTLGYMPLEQLTHADLDERTDEWAFAALVYELLTDANPFVADTHEGAVFRAEVVDAPQPSEFEPGLPRALDDIVLAALAPIPAERYQSVAEFAERLLPLLGDAGAGRASLSDAVATVLAEEAPQPAEWERLGLWDRMLRYERALHGVAAAAISGWLTWAGLLPLGLGREAGWAGVVLVAVAAALAPGLGLGLGLAALAAGLSASKGIAGGAFAITAGVYWFLLGRRGRGGEIVPIVSPAFGAAGVGPFSVLVTGFFVPPLRAAALSAAACATTMLASAASGGAAPFLDVSWRRLAHPLGTVDAAAVRGLLAFGPLFALTAWAVAGMLASAACSRATRLAAWGGMGLGAVAMFGGYAAWSLVDARLAYPSEAVLRQLGLSLILGVLLPAAGPPVRAEE